MTEALIESAVKAKIAAALDAAGVANVRISGAWDVLAAGEVKGREEPQFDTFAAVAVAPRSYETFTTPVANFAVSVSLAVRADRDPTGASFRAAVSAVLDVIQAWQSDIEAVKEDFTVEGFTPHGAKIDGGDAPSFTGGENASWMFATAFTVRGAISLPSGGSAPAASAPDAEASGLSTP